MPSCELIVAKIGMHPTLTSSNPREGAAPLLSGIRQMGLQLASGIALATAAIVLAVRSGALGAAVIAPTAIAAMALRRNATTTRERGHHLSPEP